MTTNDILKQLDDLIQLYTVSRPRSQYDDLSDLGESQAVEIVSRYAAAIRRLAPVGSAHRDGAEAMIQHFGFSNSYLVKALLGVLKGLRADYASGFLQSVQELIHADLFSDFLEMGEHLLDQGYKDPAAVVIGSVLEEHLRKLCQKAAIAITSGTGYKKADTMNAELAGSSIYGKLDQKSITAWLDLRNNAAHGKYGEYSKDQVSLMIEGVRHFMSRHPA